MHELSIAAEVIEIIEEQAKQNNADKVVVVELEIGELSGILSYALKTGLEISVKGTVLENTEIKLKEVEAEFECNQCSAIFKAHDLFTNCPKCNSFDTKIIKGKELIIKSITFEENEK